MAKDLPLGIRLDASERAALERAAAADYRALSAMGRKMIVNQLKREGWLREPASLTPPETKPARKRNAVAEFVERAMQLPDDGRTREED